VEPRPILFVIDAMIRGGGPRVCFDLIRALPDDRFRPCLVTLFEAGSLGEALAAEGVPALCLSLRRPFHPCQLLRGLPRLVAFARQHQVRLLHAHLTAAGLYGGLAARHLGLPALFTIHGALARRLPLRWVEVGVRELFPLLVAVGQEVEREAKQHLLAPCGHRVLQVYNGVDTGYWSPPRRRRDGGEVCIAMVANFFREKDHLTAIEGFRRLRERWQGPVRLLLVGEGETRRQVEDQVARTGVANVEFLGPVADIKALLERTDIALLASFSEGISLAVLEAMAMGLPVVASDVGGMREILSEGAEGFLVPPGDPESLAGALGRLVQDAGLRASLGAQGRARVEERFSLRAITSAYMEAYDKLMEPEQ
jgi:glycosyltransferase involved in cell wall biosynthesis